MKAKKENTKNQFGFKQIVKTQIKEASENNKKAIKEVITKPWFWVLYAVLLFFLLYFHVFGSFKHV